MEFGLEGKVVLVSGSSRGIGRAIAESFLREGASVVLTGRDEPSLEQTRSELDAASGADRVLSWRGDLTQPAEIEACLDAVDRRYERLDIVVANIGGGSGTRRWDVEADEWLAVLERNLLGGIRLVRAAGPRLLAGDGGAVTFVGSIAGVETTDAPIPYGAAKAALAHAAKGLARSFAPQVRVNVVAPGNVVFPGSVWERRLTENREGVDAMLAAEVPLRRLGVPEEIADAVVFLSSPRSSFSTGTCLVVDGGQTRS
jgi:3-oxoacyl-[acyl-carrier protein] reductase